ncbi:MAG TPA: hypothetical protein VFW83_01080 [Bryobacteraceae bacterium]|nr:hypothetical protein [Bryobacteraceae bacterium]
MRSFGSAVLFCLIWSGARAETIDRVAVVVNQQPIKASDILEDIRLTDFINGDKLVFDLAAEKQAASRLIDQTILRREIAAGRYGAPDPSEVDSLWKQIRGRYPSEDAFRKALADYGLTEKQLRDRLGWQVTVLQFVDLRFGNGPVQGKPNGTNQQFFDWLNETRMQAAIVYRVEALK